MRSRVVLVALVAVLICLPAAFAQTPEASRFTVTQPLDVGGTVIQPGDYLIRVLPSMQSRNEIQVTSLDMKKVFATALTVPHYVELNELPLTARFTFYQSAEGAPVALRTWYAAYPDASQGGHDLVYPEHRAKELARLSKAKVVSYKNETSVADINNSNLEVVTPEETISTYTPPAPAVAETTTTTTTSTTSETTTETAPAPSAPASSSSMTSAAPETPAPAEMPRTASHTPLIALLGLASIALAIAIRVTRTA